MKRRGVITASVLLVIALAGMGVWWSIYNAGAPVAVSGKGEPLYYRHPMTPSITSPEPAKDQMGMDYIPVYAEEAGAADDGPAADALVRISPAMVNNLGVRTARVERGDLVREIATVGYVDYDANLLSHVNLRVEGWIEDLQVRTLGERVKEGDLLFSVYSPELEAAQREYLQSAGARPGLRAAGAERLKALGLNQAQVERLDQRGRPEPLVPIYARQDGVVAKLNVREGAFVTPGTTVMTLAGLESVWVLVDIFEQQADWVAVGQAAEVRVPHKPAQVLRGKVEFIYPELDPETRTVKARLGLPNPNGVLKPNMYADVTVRADPRQQVLSVPTEAVIRTGKEARVILALGGGRFDPVEVVTGVEAGNRIEILKGLTAGDQVVVSGQFLLDSEASLNASLRRMRTPQDEPPTLVWAEGTVNAISTASSAINLHHGPIEALGWPAMTMNFAVAEAVDLSALKPGQRLRFGLAEQDGKHVVQAVELMPAVVSAEGTLDAIYPDEPAVKISHGAIPALGWPAMTMNFAVAEDIELGGFRAGQAISFSIARTDAGLLITAMTAAE